MTATDAFTRASQTYLPAAATSVRAHPVLQIATRPVGWRDVRAAIIPALAIIGGLAGAFAAVFAWWPG